MDFFERAHVPRKTDKMENKTKTVKTQYKQMLQAFKKGDNEGIRCSSDIKPGSIFEEAFHYSYTTSDCPDLDSTAETEEAENESDSITEPCENIDSEDISSADKSPSNFSNLSSELQGSDSCDSKLLPESTSEESIDESDNEQFDAEGILASKIKEKLNLNLVNISEDELSEDDKPKQKLTEQDSYMEKISRPKEIHKDIFFSKEYYGDDISIKEVIKVLNKSKTEVGSKKSKKSNKNKVPLDFSDGNKIKIRRKSEKNSPTFFSVGPQESASVNTQLNELVGQYIHPTTKTIYSEELHRVSNTALSDVFPANMSDKDLDNITVTFDEGSDVDTNSLQPEVDEELTIDDLYLGEVSQELTENSQQTFVDCDTVSTEVSQSILSDEAPAAVAYVQMKLYKGKDNFILVMRHPSEIFVHGKVQICDFNSSSEIFGYKLNPEPVKVFTPYSHHAQCIKTIINHQPINSKLCDMLTAAGLTTEEAIEIFNHHFDEDTAVVQLSKLNSPTLDFVGSSFSPMDLFSKRGVDIPPFLKKAADDLECSLYLTPPKKRFEERKIWEEVYSSIICRSKCSLFHDNYVSKLFCTLKHS